MKTTVRHITRHRITGPNTQTPVWTWDSTAFGQNPANESPNSGQPFKYNLRFPGQVYDEVTGLHYNYFRDYDPRLGRYIQNDPIGLNGGLNRYGYVGQSPLMGSDPLGLDTVTHKCALDPQWCEDVSIEPPPPPPPTPTPPPGSIQGGGNMQWGNGWFGCSVEGGGGLNSNGTPCYYKTVCVNVGPQKIPFGVSPNYSRGPDNNLSSGKSWSTGLGYTTPMGSGSMTYPEDGGSPQTGGWANKPKSDNGWGVFGMFCYQKVRCNHG